MATVAQLVEHSVVIRVVAGSNPVGRPIFDPRKKTHLPKLAEIHGTNQADFFILL